MAIDLDIPKPIKHSKRAVELPDDLWSQLDTYLEAAKITESHATAELVLEALVRKQLARDKTFQRWLKERADGACVLHTAQGEAPA